MNIHIVTKRLKEKGFTSWDLNGFETLYKRLSESNLRLWENGKRVIVLKSYSSKTYFQDWENDQILISYVYDILNKQLKNNLYFLLILNWEITSNPQLSQFINTVEKDELVCRKYVLLENEDLERVPFLQEKDFDFNQLFNYEKTFRSQLHNQDAHEIIHQMIDYYFSDDYLIEEKNEHKKRLCQLIIKE